VSKKSHSTWTRRMLHCAGRGEVHIHKTLQVAYVTSVTCPCGSLPMPTVTGSTIHSLWLPCTPTPYVTSVTPMRVTSNAYCDRKYHTFTVTSMYTYTICDLCHMPMWVTSSICCNCKQCTFTVTSTINTYPISEWCTVTCCSPCIKKWMHEVFLITTINYCNREQWLWNKRLSESLGSAVWQHMDNTIHVSWSIYFTANSWISLVFGLRST
jgi:hypothetical protein